MDQLLTAVDEDSFAAALTQQLEDMRKAYKLSLRDKPVVDVPVRVGRGLSRRFGSLAAAGHHLNCEINSPGYEWNHDILATIRDNINLKFSVAHQIKIRTARRLGLSHMDLV